MASKRKRIRKGKASTTTPPPKPNLFESEVLRRLVATERRAEYAEKELLTLKDTLTSMLLPEQVEAARIAGCAPHIYALEWIKLWAQSSEWNAKIPSFSANVENLKTLRGI